MTELNSLTLYFDKLKEASGRFQGAALSSAITYGLPVPCNGVPQENSQPFFSVPGGGLRGRTVNPDRLLPHSLKAAGTDSQLLASEDNRHLPAMFFRKSMRPAFGGG